MSLKFLNENRNEEGPGNSPQFFLNDEPNMGIFKTKAVTSLAWSVLFFGLNIFNLFACIFWFSIHQGPTGLMYFFALVIEYLMFFEVIFRIVLRIFSPNAYTHLNLLHAGKQDGFWTFVLLFISSFPVLTLDIIIGGLYNADDDITSYLIILKVLRCFEIHRVLTKLEETLFYKKFKTLIFIKFLMNFTYVLLITHISICSWLLIDRTPQMRISMPGTNPHNPFKDSILDYIRYLPENRSSIFSENEFDTSFSFNKIYRFISMGSEYFDRV